ncbi:MAG: hypothetical protein ABSG68_13745 [Thermoguttaceae bacterium]
MSSYAVVRHGVPELRRRRRQAYPARATAAVPSSASVPGSGWVAGGRFSAKTVRSWK